jgi:pimeloyl-ACP methyl ester carboxylesterase
MRSMPAWTFMEAVAHTLAYDGIIVADTLHGKPIQPARWATVTVPTIVLDGGTIPWLHTGAEALAKTLPNARHQTLAGQPHDVQAAVIAPVIAEFFRG